MGNVQHILAIDQGEKHFGICLARNDGQHVVPLFLGTAEINPKEIESKVVDRARLRRFRRTTKEHQRRLKRLRDALGGKAGPLHNHKDLLDTVVAFCKRRGHFYQPEDLAEQDEEEFKNAVSHQEFLSSLDVFLSGVLSDGAQKSETLKICQSILSKQSRRPMRVDARNVGVCRWEGCNLRRTRAGLGSLIMGISGKMKPFVEPRQDEAAPLVPLDLVKQVCQRAMAGETSGDLLKALDKAILEGLGLDVPAKQTAKTIPEIIDRLGNPEEGEKLLPDRVQRIEALSTLRRWGQKVRKASIRDMVARDLEAARNPERHARSSFCKAHQEQYVDCFLRGERPPLKDASADVSRRLAIVTSKLASYLKKRVLPLIPEDAALDALVVEASAFDTLRILFKSQRQGAGQRPQQSRKDFLARQEDKLYELYWKGPRAEFNGDTRLMLQTEFGGLCAYCGKPVASDFEIDHIFAQRDFPMRGYLAIVPAHRSCNQQKGKSSLLHRGLSIHPEAVKAYASYVETKKQKAQGFFHPFLFEKKELLTLMGKEALVDLVERYGGDRDKAENYLVEKLGRRLVSATASSRYGAHLKKALPPLLGMQPQTSCTVCARHVAILREALIGRWDYDKQTMKREGDKVENHAVDAYTLALGQASGFFGQMAFAERFGRSGQDLLNRTLRMADPKFIEKGSFDLDFQPIQGLEAFSENMRVVCGEVVNGAAKGIALASFNPKSKKSSFFDTSLYRFINSDEKVGIARRVGASAFFDTLKRKGNAGNPVKYIERVCHPRLREQLLGGFASNGLDGVESALVKWYKETSLQYQRCQAKHISHPTIQKRWDAIESFLKNDVASASDIPSGFSLSFIQEGRTHSATPLVRKKHTHLRVANGGTVAVIVAYRRDGAAPDKSRPIVLKVAADWSIGIEGKGGMRDIPALPQSLSHGLNHDKSNLSSRIETKKRILRQWLSEVGCVQNHWITAGSTIHRTDGSQVFVRNHKTAPAGGYSEIVSVA